MFALLIYPFRYKESSLQSLSLPKMSQPESFTILNFEIRLAGDSTSPTSSSKSVKES